MKRPKAGAWLKALLCVGAVVLTISNILLVREYAVLRFERDFYKAAYFDRSPEAPSPWSRQPDAE